MSKSWIGRGWANQARIRKAQKFAKFNERYQRPVTAEELSRDAARMLRRLKRRDG